MPRAAKPARLWLRPTYNGRAPVYVVKDGPIVVSTGHGRDDREAAEQFLNDYLRSKHDPSAQLRRSLDDTPIADVLSVYMGDVVEASARAAQGKKRMERLILWWGDKALSEVSPAACRAYAKHRATADRTVKSRPRKKGGHTVKAVTTETPRSGGGARRDLEDLRAAINHHARRGLHVGQVFVTLPAKGKPRSKYLTRDEVAAMLWYCWRHKRPQVVGKGPRKGQPTGGASYYDMRHVARFILLGIYTGSRSGPLLCASITPGPGRAFLDLDAGIYHRLPEDMEEAANKKSPTVPIVPRLLAHLRRWRDRGIVSRYVVEWNGKPVASLKTAWDRVVKEARLGGKPDGAHIEGNPTPHTLRHIRVTWLKQDGVSSWHVGGYVGMSEAMVERVYGHHDPNFMAEVVASIGRRPGRRSKPAN